jgi:hypothetical protein
MGNHWKAAVICPWNWNLLYGTNIREMIEEDQEIRRHKEALDALVRMRSRLLGESLEARMRRAQDHGEWNNLSQEECGKHQGRKAVFKVPD